MLEAPQIQHFGYDSTLPVMDREQIDMLTMGGDEGKPNSVALELLALFKMEAEEKLAQLDKICSERDGDALRKLLHFIAGSGGNLGLLRLNAFYRAIEKAIDDGDLEDYEACARLIPQEYELGCKEYVRMLGLD